MFIKNSEVIKNHIINLQGFKNDKIKAIKTPRHYHIFFENIEILDIKFQWIDKSDNYFEIEGGVFLATNLNSNEIEELQNIIKDIINSEWLEFRDNIEVE